MKIDLRKAEEEEKLREKASNMERDLEKMAMVAVPRSDELSLIPTTGREEEDCLMISTLPVLLGVAPLLSSFIVPLSSLKLRCAKTVSLLSRVLFSALSWRTSMISCSVGHQPTNM